jgi:hypothetical protein
MYGRGTCRVCGRDISLRKDGKVRAHGAKVTAWPPANCTGGGEPPAEEVDGA